MSWRRILDDVVFTCVVLLGTLSVLAQTTTSNMIGTLVDASGAGIPNAKVVLTAPATGTTRTASSNTTGLFRVTELQPGTYVLHIQADGFKTFDMKDIDLSSSQTRDLGTLALEVGSRAESITVTADASQVQTASSERGSEVTGTQINEAPLKGKDPWSLIATLPGIVDANVTNTSSGGLSNREMANHFSPQGTYINGSSTSNKNVTFDGVSSMDQGSNASAFINPSTDAIAEVKVIANGGQAEYGRQSGGTVNFIIKNGTKEFHGSAYWNRRHENLNANDFFNNRLGIQRPLYRFFIGGYTIGGPVYIPKVFNTNRQKLFFFVSQEYIRRLPATQTVTANLPTEAERKGDFSNSRNQAGQVVPIIDPTTRTQFPGNIIPANRIDPTGQAILNLQRLPNGYVNPAPGQLYTANFLDSYTGIQKRRADIARVDWQISNNMSLFLRAGQDIDNTRSGLAVAPGIGEAINQVPGYAFAAHLTQTLGPTTVNEILFGLGHDNSGNIHPDDSLFFRTSTLNPPRIVPIPTGPDYEPFLPAFTFGGNSFANQASYNPFGAGSAASGSAPSNNYRDSYTIKDDLSKVVGAHSFKTGLYIERYTATDPTSISSVAGSFNFTSTTANPLDTGNSYANALVGIFQTYSEGSKRVFPFLSQWEVEAYVQDNWRVHKRLTLDYGLRSYHVGPFHENRGVSANFYPSLFNPGQAPRLYRPGCAIVTTGNCPAASQVAVDPGTGATTFFALQGTIVPNSGNPVNGMNIKGLTGQGDVYELPFLVFAPRLGFAWDPFGDGKTSVRASAGLYYNRPNGTSVPGSTTGPPVIYSNQLSYSYINQIPQLVGKSALAPVTGGNAQGDRKIESAMNANLTVQRFVGFNTVVDLGWVGNFARHAPQTITLNPIPLLAYANPANLYNGTEINQNFLRTAFPGMGAISYSTTGLSSLNYHALQAGLTHQVTRGLRFSVSYTFSKALGTNGWDAYHNQRQWFYGPLAQDRTHALGLNYSYALPRLMHALGPVRHLTNGWNFSGVTRFQSGAPVTPTCSSTQGFPFNDPSETGGGARCQAVADPKNYTQSFYTNFNTAAFTLAPTGTFGNTGQGILRQPSWTNFDMSLSRDIQVGRDTKRVIKLRLEAYNVFNHPEFITYGTTYTFGAGGVNTNTTTGQFTSANSPRVVETTLRFNW